jgi:hypothetical protein
MVRTIAVALGLLVVSNASVAQDQPSAGYTTQGLADQREPWKLNWADPENEWLLVSTDSQNGSWYLQLASDLRAKGLPRTARKAWLKIDYSKQRSETAREAKALWIVDCQAQTFTVRNMIWYSASGRIEETRSYPTGDIVPGSMAATISKRVCAA